MGITDINKPSGKGTVFSSNLDVKSMVLMLQKKIPRISWRMGDSSYDDFYVMGHSEENIKIKITCEDAPGKFYLGIYFYSLKSAIDPERQLTLHQELQREILMMIKAMKHNSSSIRKFFKKAWRQKGLK